MSGPGDVRAMVLRQLGGDLEVERFPEPQVGPGAVLATVHGAGICGTDMHLQQGRLPIPLPLVLGHEAVGRVAALGDGVTTDATGAALAVGDRVSWASNIPCGGCFYCTEVEEPSLCETRRVYGINQGVDAAPQPSGAWASQMHLQPGSTIVRLPDETGFDDVIALGCAGPTATHAVLGLARPQKGDTVVVQGSGPVGLACAMLATVCGADQVIIVGGPAGRLETARRLGIGRAHIDIFENEDPAARVEQVLAETPGGRGADLVIEATGVPAAVAEGMDMARRGGTLLVVGQYTDHGVTPLNPHHVTHKQLHVQGSWAFSPQDHIRYVQSVDRKSTRLNSSHRSLSRMPSSA